MDKNCLVGNSDLIVSLWRKFTDYDPLDQKSGGYENMDILIESNNSSRYSKIKSICKRKKSK